MEVSACGVAMARGMCERLEMRDCFLTKRSRKTIENFWYVTRAARIFAAAEILFLGQISRVSCFIYSAGGRPVSRNICKIAKFVDTAENRSKRVLLRIP